VHKFKHSTFLSVCQSLQTHTLSCIDYGYDISNSDSYNSNSYKRSKTQLFFFVDYSILYFKPNSVRNQWGMVLATGTLWKNWLSFVLYSRYFDFKICGWDQKTVRDSGPGPNFIFLACKSCASKKIKGWNFGATRGNIFNYSCPVQAELGQIHKSV
jgi:hypothetical protein